MLKIQILGNTATRRNLRTLLENNETCTGSNSKNRVSKHEVHKPSIHEEGLPFPTKNLGVANIEDQCVEMVNVYVFVNESSHSSWTELFGELGGLQEQELSLFNIAQEIDIGAF